MFLLIIASYIGMMLSSLNQFLMKRFLLLSIFLLLGLRGWTQQAEQIEKNDIVTDRPDQTESSVVVPVGYLQIESGAIYTRIDEQESEFIYNTTLFRYGLLPWLELRLVQDIGQRQLALDGGELTSMGFFPLRLGTKVHLLNERGLVPETALLYEAELPTGSSEFKPEGASHTIRALLSYTLTESIDLGTNLGINVEDQQKGVSPVYTLSFGFQLTDRLSAFTEVYGLFEREGEDRHGFDGGFLYLLRPNLQLDISAGAGITEAADDGFISAGFAWRIPR